MSSTGSTTRPAATAAAAEKQGIVVAILGSDDSGRGRAWAAASLRRTLSADMSSKKWLAQNGFHSPMKKIASSEELLLPALDSSSSSEDDEEEDMNCPGELDIWNSIQEQNKKNKKEIEKVGGEFDMWSSILSQKEKDIESSKSLPPPYIHPLVKRSASSLSEKSLEICTESLGSETGSDCFSSESSSDGEADHIKEDEEEEQQQENQVVIDGDHQEEYRPVKFNYYSGGRKSAARSFPPPLPSLSRNDGSPTLRMQTRRDNGRLVMEAVSVPSQKNFAAQRRDGRLVLTFVNSTSTADDVYAIAPSAEEVKKEETEEFEEQLINFEDENDGQIDQEEEEEEEDDDDDDDDEEEEEEFENGVKRIEIETEKEAEVPKVLSTRLINFHRLALMVNKPIGLPNRNISATAWPNNKLNEEEEEEEATPVIAQSLPPRPRPVGRLPQAVGQVSATATTAATTASSFNAYEYFWRRAKPTGSIINDKKLIVSQDQTKNDNRLGNNQQQQLVVLRGNEGDYLVPLLKGCKEPRRTLFWEPHCIATS